MTIRRIYTVSTQIQMNICGLLRMARGSRLLWRVKNNANLGYWHLYTTGIIISSSANSHPLSTSTREVAIRNILCRCRWTASYERMTNSEFEFRRKLRFRPRAQVPGRRFCYRVRGVLLQPGRQLRHLEQPIVRSEQTSIRADHCKSKATI